MFYLEPGLLEFFCCLPLIHKLVSRDLQGSFGFQQVISKEVLKLSVASLTVSSYGEDIRLIQIPATAQQDQLDQTGVSSIRKFKKPCLTPC